MYHSILVIGCGSVHGSRSILTAQGHTASSTQILLSELWFKFSYKYITASEVLECKAYDSLVDCLPSTVSTGTPCKYEPIKYGPYIHSTFKMFKEYADRGE